MTDQEKVVALLERFVTAYEKDVESKVAREKASSELTATLMDLVPHLLARIYGGPQSVPKKSTDEDADVVPLRPETPPTPPQ